MLHSVRLVGYSHLGITSGLLVIQGFLRSIHTSRLAGTYQCSVSAWQFVSTDNPCLTTETATQPMPTETLKLNLSDPVQHHYSGYNPPINATGCGLSAGLL